MESTSRKGAIGITVGILVVIIAIWTFTAVSFVRTDGGHVTVVRNGGPFDDNQIRDVVPPGSSRKFEGVYSQEHPYPASQRYYTISSDPGRGDSPGVDIFKGSTSDGVQGIGLEGTVQFTLNADRKTLEEFDNKFGTRTFPVVGSSDRLHAWDGDRGWSAFLDAVFRQQVLDNALRIEIQKYKCVELIPSCAYLNATQSAAPKVTGADGTKANATLATIQSDIATELQNDLDTTLGGRYLNIGQFTISKVTLPTAVEQQIQESNAAKVAVQKETFLAQQKVQAAIGERNANYEKAKGIEALNKAYAHSKQKAAIDAIAALPQNLTTLVIGGNGGLAQLVGK